MCGVVGGFQPAEKLLTMLHNIQHRGFMSCGLATDVSCWTNDGPVANLAKRPVSGTLGVGHVRYCTNSESPIQPVTEWPLAFAFNGEVEDGDTMRVFEAAKTKDFGSVRGAYSFVYKTQYDIFAGRDPYGFHPLYWSDELQCVASEPCADPTVRWYAVWPGTVINVRSGARAYSTNPTFSTKWARCFFEWVYFSSAQSHFDLVSVYAIRRALGELIAKREEVKADMVVPVPDTSIAAAEAIAEKLGIPCRMAIYRDRYAERTFLNEDGVKSKYKIIPEALYGKILLVDDSIVRGNTLNYLVPLIKRYCSEVHVRVTCPQITHPCRYGVNITEAGASNIDGADSVKFLSPKDLNWIDGMCKACVTGKYPNERKDKCFSV